MVTHEPRMVSGFWMLKGMPCKSAVGKAYFCRDRMGKIDPFLTVVFLKTGQSANTDPATWGATKPTLATLTNRPESGRLHSDHQ